MYFMPPIILRANHNQSNGPVINSVIEFTAGSIGATVNIMVGHPLDTCKVKMQTFPKLYTNIFNCLKLTIVKDGWRRGLYAGVTPALVADISEKSILFLSYDLCQGIVRRFTQTPQLTMLDAGLSGFIASFFSCFTCCPTELIKCRLQAIRETGGQPIGAFALTRQILKHEGITGMYRGLSMTMLREMPGYFFYFGGYELAKQVMGIKSIADDKELGLLKTVIAGGFGGCCCWICIFPFDVIKSRLQIGAIDSKGLAGNVLAIIRREGFLSLYNGLTPALIRTFPATGSLFLAYEYSKCFMETIAEKTL